MAYTPLFEQLIDAMRCLPGVGPKSAQRMALHLLQRNRQAGIKLSSVMQLAMENIGFCKKCQNLSEQSHCNLCENKQRDHTKLCITGSPADVFAIEQTGNYRGLYFVLKGLLSPIDGIGPNEIGIDLLLTRFEEPELSEIILATSPTVEGEATAHYISQLAKRKQIKTTRIAFGVPVGGELEYIDGHTLSRALEKREAY